MKKRIFIIITLGFIIGCSSENISQNPEDDSNGNNNGTTASAKTDDPKDLYIVNLGIGQKGDPAHITRHRSVTLRGNDNYTDIIEGKRVFHLFGANYNTDGSVPLTEDDQPEAHSKYSVRNNLTASFVFTTSDDPKANMIFRVKEAVNLQNKGINTARDVTKSITSGKVSLVPLAEKTDVFPLPYSVDFTDSALDTKDYGNLNIGNKTDDIPAGSMTFSQISEILKTPGDYPVIGFEFSIDDDNKGGANNNLPKLIVPNFD